MHSGGLRSQAGEKKVTGTERPGGEKETEDEAGEQDGEKKIKTFLLY